VAGNLKHYQDAQGRVFSLDENDAKLLGYAPVDISKVRAQMRAADEAATNAGLSEREKALAEGEAKLAADREAFAKEQAEAKTGNRGR